MNDLLDQLSALRTTSGPVADSTVSADVRRGRRAVSRRRAVRGAGLGACALAIGGVTTAVVTSSPAVHDGAGPTGGARLVDYTGAQLPGFTIDKVPDGFVLQGASAGVLDVARPGDHSVLDDFENKIVVTVQDATPAPAPGPEWSYKERARVSRNAGGTLHYQCPDGSKGVIHVTANGLIHNPCLGDSDTPSDAPETVGTAIDVDGAAGTISTNSEGAKYFKYVDNDRRVVIQVWPTLGLSDAQLREFADGVTVAATAQLSQG